MVRSRCRYQPTLHFWKALYTKEDLQTVRGGMIWGVGVSGATTITNNVIEKAKDIFSTKNKENSNIVPAT